MTWLALLCALLACFPVGSYHLGKVAILSLKDQKRSVKLHSSLENGMGNAEKLWSEQVEYLDLMSAPATAPENTRQIPLFLLGKAFFPQGRTFLNIFEMRYRTMMYEISKTDDMFGYIHTDHTSGQIARIGTLVKVVNRQFREDGTQIVELEGVSRFRVVRIAKTLPYIAADVELDVEDNPCDEAAATELEKNTYNALKYYMRLAKCIENARHITISQAAKKFRITNTGLDMPNAQRRTAFSFAVANMIDMTQPRELQLLLQTQDVVKRLQVENEILTQASELLGDQLLAGGVVSSIQREVLREAAFSGDDDADILPGELVVQEKPPEEDEEEMVVFDA
eukprot:gene26948-32559_t